MAAFAVTGSTSSVGAPVVAGLGGRQAIVALLPGRSVALDGVGCLVSLVIGSVERPDGTGAPDRLADLRRALAVADATGVPRVVHLSSAVVYGAAAGNAVPLSDDTPVRPDPGFAWAVELAEAERLVAEWRDGAPGRAAAVLRPALVVSPDDDGFWPRALGGLSGPRVAGERRPVQFVHVEDLARAVITCATASSPVDGPLNVAPQGWIDADDAAAFAGAAFPPPRLPARLVRPIRRLLWAFGLGATPPEVEAYATHPWVVAADRLGDLGWIPTHSSEAAVVAISPGATLATLSPRRRQEILLAATAASAGGLVLGLAGLLVHAARSRRA